MQETASRESASVDLEIDTIADLDLLEGTGEDLPEDQGIEVMTTKSTIEMAGATKIVTTQEEMTGEIETIEGEEMILVTVDLEIEQTQEINMMLDLQEETREKEMIPTGEERIEDPIDLDLIRDLLIEDQTDLEEVVIKDLRDMIEDLIKLLFIRVRDVHPVPIGEKIILIKKVTKLRMMLILKRLKMDIQNPILLITLTNDGVFERDISVQIFTKIKINLKKNR